MIHLFNPENDLALGLGCRHYTPPPHAAALHRAGALLPLWWAEEGDRVVAPESLRDEAGALREKFGLYGDIFAPRCGYGEPAPWGWSLDAVRQFRNAGVDEAGLPSDEAVERMRRISHRRSAIGLLAGLGDEYPRGEEFTDASAALSRCRASDSYVKSPWSGSGRGVFCSSALSRDALRRRLEGIIHRQGSVIVEPALCKILDFAALFYSNACGVAFRGLSVFQTESQGMYAGNIVARQEDLRRIIGGAGVSCMAELSDVIPRLGILLSRLVGDVYKGWLGIDMMIYRDSSGTVRLMPCVELNLRMTMGVVAMKIADRLQPESPCRLLWLHNSPAGAPDTVLLPPAEGFTLILRKF